MMLDDMIRNHAQNVAEYEAGILDLCILTDSERREFIEKFNQWISERSFSWRHGIFVLRIAIRQGKTLPWKDEDNTIFST